MSSTTAPRTIGGQGSQNPGQQPMAPGSQQIQGTPPTGLQQQLASLNQSYAQASQMQDIGVDVHANDAQQNQGLQPQGIGTAAQAQQQGRGATSLQQLANKLASSYGLATGRGQLVDEMGNPLMTPDQLAGASGGHDTLGTAAAKLNYIQEAIGRQVQQQQEQKSVGALQAGLGQVNSRGRGSLAGMRSGMYEQLSNLYQNNQYHAADFSYFITREHDLIQQDMQNKALKLAKKNAQFGFIGGLVSGAMGNPGGFAQAGANAGGTGWFLWLISASLLALSMFGVVSGTGVMTI